MRDLIIFCPDTPALVATVRAKHPHRLNEEDPDNPRFLVDKTDTVRGPGGTLAVVRCRDGDHREPPTEAELLELQTAGVVQVLGTWAEVQADPDARAIYCRVYPRTPVTFTDENGAEHTITPPEELGRFADV